jgi:hypothetical protein
MHRSTKRGIHQLIIWKFLISFIAVWLFQGCAVTGPKISSTEEAEARREIRVRVLQNWIRDVQRSSAVIYRVRKTLPSKDCCGFPAITVISLNKMKAEDHELWEIVTDRSLPKTGYLLLPVPGGLAEQAGIKLYDVALELPCGKLQPHEKVTIKLEDRVVEFPAEKVGVKLNDWAVVPSGQANAFVDLSRNLYIFSGLLRYVNDDNQLAVIVGHELAHLERGHIGKKAAVGLCVSLLTLAAEIVITQGQSNGELSKLVTDLVIGKFSRDQEREADYFGLKYCQLAGYDIEKGANVWLDIGSNAPASLTKSLLSTHPNSAERLARLRKIISLLKEGKTWDEFEKN